MSTFGREFEKFIKAGKAAKKWKSRAEFGRMHGLSQPFMSDVVKGKRMIAMETLEKVLKSAGFPEHETEVLRTSLSRQKANESAALAPLLASVERETAALRAGGLVLLKLLDEKRAEVPNALRKLFQPH